ncbi:core protein precursor pVI [Aviadenovirus bubonis]|nr:core protein precursor pVI [Owl adenovirus]
MDYATLSPHVGTWALRDDHFGDSGMRGGAINWGNLGSRLSSALSSTGRWLYNTGNRFVNSNTFNQIKQGIQDSGVIRNVGSLAGETISALTDIGRLKLQQDIERLRRKALGEEGPPNQADLQALIQALQAQAAADSAAAVTPAVPTTRPIPEMVTEVRSPVTSSAPAVPVDTPTTLEYNPPAAKRRRRRQRPAANWRTRLNTLSGTGVTSLSRRMCY